MSKTTIFLLAVLLLFVGFLTYLIYGKTQNPVIKSFAKPSLARITPTPINTELSLSTKNQSIRPGQIIPVNVIIHNTSNHPNLAQLEIAYDPTAVTIDSIAPGNFFDKPTLALRNIDPVAGRLSYALRCPSTQQLNTASNCNNADSNIIAIITLTINPYISQNTTTLSFQPKTVVRTVDGRDLLKKTSNLQLTITRAYYPVASSSGIVRQKIQQSVLITPPH